MGEKVRAQTSDPEVSVPAPAELRVSPLKVADDEDYLVFSHALPRWELPPQLSRAEREVVGAILAGASRDEVARMRGTSPRTVANLIAQAFRKLGVKSRLELAARLRLPS